MCSFAIGYNKNGMNCSSQENFPLWVRFTRIVSKTRWKEMLAAKIFHVYYHEFIFFHYRPMA